MKWARNRPPAVDRVNRIVLLVLGALLVGLGAVALLAHDGRTDLDQPPSLYQQALDSVDARPVLWWTIIIASGAVATIVGLVWAIAQLTGRSGGRRAPVTQLSWPHRGTLRVQPTAIARAAARDFRTLPGVVGSNVRVIELGDRTRLFARLDLARRTDANAVENEAEAVLTRVCEATDAEQVEARLRLNLATEEAPRVQ